MVTPLRDIELESLWTVIIEHTIEFTLIPNLRRFENVSVAVTFPFHFLFLLILLLRTTLMKMFMTSCGTAQRLLLDN